MSPWEQRERGGPYYSRSRKEGGRVIREYVGGGMLGELAAWVDAQERRRREQKEARLREERERLDALSARVEEVCDAAEVITRDALLASGYHQHNRGEWRKRREQPR